MIARVTRLRSHPGARAILAGALFAFILVLSIWTLPAVLNRQPSTGMSSAERINAVNTTRAALVTLLAASAAMGTLIYTVRTFALNRMGQVTDRYSKAVEQLAADRQEMRIGGIYALERIARDSRGDQPAVTEVLTAFLRTASGKRTNTAYAMPEDMQAALTVLGRRKRHTLERPLDLRSADLRGGDLTAADLTNSRLDDANLHGAQLVGSDLRGAVLSRACLDGSSLADASLLEAVLDGVSLHQADLYHARIIEGELAPEQLGVALNTQHIIRFMQSTSGRLARL